MPTVRQGDVDPETWAKIMAAAGGDPPAPARRVAADRGPLVAAAFDPPGAWTIPLRLDPVTNGGALKRGLIGRAGRDRRAVAAALSGRLREVAEFADAARAGRPVACRITRLGGGLMDTDNLEAAAKWVRDAVALFLGVGDGPAGPVRWEYAQEACGAWGVRVELEAAAPAPRPKKEKGTQHVATANRLYSPDELEFLRAVERFRRDRRRPFPTFVEVLGVALGLGYRKAGPGNEKPPGDSHGAPGVEGGGG